MDDTVVSGSKQGVVVTNYYQSLYKDDTPGEEDNVLFSSIRDNEVKSMDQSLDEGEYVKDDAMTAVVTSVLLHNNHHNSSMDSRATTTIGDVEMDAGMLQTK